MGKGDGGSCDRPQMSLGGVAPAVLESSGGTIDRDGRELVIRFKDFEIRAVGTVDTPTQDVTMAMGDDGRTSTSAPFLLLHLNGGSGVGSEGAFLLEPGVYMMTSTRLERAQEVAAAAPADEPDDVFLCWHDLNATQLQATREAARLTAGSPTGFFGVGEMRAALADQGLERTTSDVDRLFDDLRRYKVLAADDDGRLHRITTTGRRILHKADNPELDKDRWNALDRIQQEALQNTWWECQVDPDFLPTASNVAAGAIMRRPNSGTGADYNEQATELEQAVEQLKELGLVKDAYGGEEIELTREGYEVLAAG